MLLPPFPFERDEIGLLEDPQMLGDGWSCHRQTLAKLGERLTGLQMQAIEQFTPALVGQSLENEVAVLV